jgi:hypothetical protein
VWVVDRFPRAAKLKRAPAELPRALLPSHRGSQSFPGGRWPELSSPRTSEETAVQRRPDQSLDADNRRASWRTGLCKARRSRSMPSRAGHPRRLTSQMRGRRLPVLPGALDSGGHDGGLHVSLRRLVCSCARHLGCASRVSSRCGSRNGAGVFNRCATRAEALAHPSRKLMPSPGGPSPTPCCARPGLAQDASSRRVDALPSVISGESGSAARAPHARPLRWPPCAGGSVDSDSTAPRTGLDPGLPPLRPLLSPLRLSIVSSDIALVKAG